MYLLVVLKSVCSIVKKHVEHIGIIREFFALGDLFIFFVPRGIEEIALLLFAWRDHHPG